MVIRREAQISNLNGSEGAKLGSKTVEYLVHKPNEDKLPVSDSNSEQNHDHGILSFVFSIFVVVDINRQ